MPVVHIAVWLNPYSIITCFLSLSVLCGEAFWLGRRLFFIICTLCPFAAPCEFDSGAILESAGSTDEVWGGSSRKGRAGAHSLTLPDRPHPVSLLRPYLEAQLGEGATIMSCMSLGRLFNPIRQGLNNPLLWAQHWGGRLHKKTQY